MQDDLSPSFIQQLLAAQGCPIDEADAALIAANLGAQLRTADLAADGAALPHMKARRREPLRRTK